MSAPDPKAWAITPVDADRMKTLLLYRGETQMVLEIVKAVARRRALDELRALAEDANSCLHCASKNERLVAYGGRSYHMVSGPDGGDTKHFHCTASAIHDRIAAIEAEGS